MAVQLTCSEMAPARPKPHPPRPSARAPGPDVRASSPGNLGASGFDDFAGFEAFGADSDSPDGPVLNDLDSLEIRKETARGNAGGFQTDPAFFLRDAPSGDASSCNWTFSTNRANLRHLYPPLMSETLSLYFTERPSRGNLFFQRAGNRSLSGGLTARRRPGPKRAHASDGPSPLPLLPRSRGAGVRTRPESVSEFSRVPRSGWGSPLTPLRGARAANKCQHETGLSCKASVFGARKKKWTCLPGRVTGDLSAAACICVHLA